MKATIEVPDELYRQVKAKSALEGRPIREVAEVLFRRYVSGEEPAQVPSANPPSPAVAGGEAVPAWFGVLGQHLDAGKAHDMDSIRESIATGIAKERKL